MRDVSFRPLARANFPQLFAWQAQPYVARWWGMPADLAEIEAEYGPPCDGLEKTEVFVIVADQQDVGIIQWYRMADYPDWERAVSVCPEFGGVAAGIDYYIGDPALVGQGLGSAAIEAFVEWLLVGHPDIEVVGANIQQENIASWRALEKAGFERRWAGDIESEDPTDSGPSYVYVKRRPTA